jgi:hypothetical protein
MAMQFHTRLKIRSIFQTSHIADDRRCGRRPPPHLEQLEGRNLPAPIALPMVSIAGLIASSSASTTTARVSASTATGQTSGVPSVRFAAPASLIATLLASTGGNSAMFLSGVFAGNNPPSIVVPPTEAPGGVRAFFVPTPTLGSGAALSVNTVANSKNLAQSGGGTNSVEDSVASDEPSSEDSEANAGNRSPGIPEIKNGNLSAVVVASSRQRMVLVDGNA